MPGDLIDRVGGFSSATAFKGPARAATSVNVTLSGFQTIDGEAFTGTEEGNGESMRVLVRAQNDAKENGVYLIKTGLWTRTRDFDGNGDFVEGTRIHVHSGSTRAAVYLVTTPDPIVIDTDAITFVTESSLLGSGVEYVIDGGGDPITTGIKGFIEVPFQGEITAVRLLADQVGSMVVDIFKDVFAAYPPTVADTITAAAKPTLSVAQSSEDTTLTDWTTAVAQGDILTFNVDSNTGIEQVTVVLEMTRIQ